MVIQAILGGAQLASSAISGINSFKGGKSAKNTPIGIGPLFSRISGQQALAEAKEQSDLQMKQSNIAYEEGLRQEALRRSEIESFKESQTNAFASSGINVSGSALSVLRETSELGDQELAAMRKAAIARSDLLQQDSLRILRGGYGQQFGSNIEAQMSEFNFANQQRQLASKANQAGLQGAFAGASLLGLGASAGYNWLKKPSGGGAKP